MHPLDDVTRGERLIKDVYEAIRKSPHWETSVLIVTFDEHGGFYDHVAPPAAVPPGDVETASYVQHDFSFDQARCAGADPGDLSACSQGCDRPHRL